MFSRSLSCCTTAAAAALASYFRKRKGSQKKKVYQIGNTRTSEEDVEREGGSRVENGCVSMGGVGADGERGVGSLATLVMGGAKGGESAGAGASTGADAGAGAGALAVRVGRGTEASAAAAAVMPVSRETSLREIGLPVKNSLAEREGSIDGAGGKMSDWKDSDLLGCVQGVSAFCSKG